MTHDTTIDLLCRLRFEVRDWQSALGERDGLDELCTVIDAKVESLAAVDGYRCNGCKRSVPNDSGHCPHCGTVWQGEGDEA